MSTRRTSGPLRALTALCLLALTSCAPPGEAWVRRPVRFDLPAITALPLLGERVPVVSGVVDGHPARLLLDTGAEITLLDSGFVAATGLPVVPLANRVTGSRGEVIARVFDRFTRVDRLQLGEAAALALEPLIMDMSIFELELDGIVGMDVLGNWATAFDDEAQLVTILPTGETGSALATTFVEGAIFDGWEWIGEGSLPAIELSFGDGLTFPALIDTGAVLGTIPEALVEPLGLKPKGTFASNSIAGTEQVTRYSLAELSFGAFTLANVSVDAAPRSDGLVGYRFLRRLVFVVDGPARMFLFCHQPARRDDNG